MTLNYLNTALNCDNLLLMNRAKLPVSSVFSLQTFQFQFDMKIWDKKDVFEPKQYDS